MIKMTLLKYPKIPRLGSNNRFIEHIFDTPVEISEKLDGSMCRLNFTESHVECGSKNVNTADEKMFAIAYRQADQIWKDKVWWTFGDNITLFTEFFNKTHHNVINYKILPQRNFYLFGAICNNKHLQTDELIELAKELKIEPLNILETNIKINNPDDLIKYLDGDSCLGGGVREGVVIRNHNFRYDHLSTLSQAFVGFPVSAKLVRDDFKERLNVEWSAKKQRETPLAKIAAEFFTDARFRKAIQHLNDEEKITYEMNNLKDIIPEFYSDLIDEERQEIMELALDDFWRQLKRKSDNFVVKEWKRYLVDKQFSE
jgi:hypothetical protein